MSDSPPELLDGLRRADEEEVVRLRGGEIPRRVGMAGAARLLAVEVSGQGLQRIESLCSNGALGKQLAEAPEASREELVVGLLREQLASAVSAIRELGERWLNGSLRMEGQALALEERAKRILEMAEVQSDESAPEAGSTE